MRITGGRHRSRKLEAPKGIDVRPTSDKVRQAVFNMLNARGAVQDAVVIDAFCGTGAMGLEALSQGAAFCTFFDSNKHSVKLCKINIYSLNEEVRSRVIFQDVTKNKPRPEDQKPADLVFLDPPYHQKLIPKAARALYKNNWPAEDALLIMEMASDEQITSELINVLDEKKYGDTKILIGTLKS